MDVQNDHNMDHHLSKLHASSTSGPEFRAGKKVTILLPYSWRNFVRRPHQGTVRESSDFACFSTIFLPSPLPTPKLYHPLRRSSRLKAVWRPDLQRNCGKGHTYE